MKASVARRLRGVSALLVCALASLWARGQDGSALVLGVVPQFPTVETQQRWLPLVQALEAACARRIELALSGTIPQFEKRFLAGEFDLVYLNPYHMVMAAKAAGYEPLVRDGSRQLKGILVVRQDSPVQTVRELSGQTIAFPAPNAFGASLYMRALLEREFGVRPVAHYAKTHSSAYRQVITGDAAAAGGVKVTLDAQVPDVRDRLRVLYETPGVPSHPLASHPRVNDTDRDCIVKTLTAPAPDADMRQRLADIQMPSPTAAHYRRDYQGLERLGLADYVVME